MYFPDCILSEIPLRFVPKSPFDNKQELIQVMARCLTGNKPLPEAILTEFIAIYICHKDSMC